MEVYKSGNFHNRLKQIDSDGSFKHSNIVRVNVSFPENYYLCLNYPNPFNPGTRIDSTLPEKQFLSLKVYNALGEIVKMLLNEQKEAGSYSEVFDASGLKNGLYICGFETPGFAENKKMTFIK